MTLRLGPKGQSRSRRRGSMYVLVLGTAIIVMVMGLSALTISRINRRTTQDTADMGAARVYARAAVEAGMFWVENDASWRAGAPQGYWVLDKPFGQGTYSFEVHDKTDADFKNNDTDPIVIIGTGMKGNARCKLQVTLVSDGAALTCLETSLHAGNDLLIQDTAVSGDQILSANDSVDASTANVAPAVEAGTTITGGTYTGLQTPGVAARTMPDPVAVFDFYTDEVNGTAIDITSLPSVAPRLLDGILLSPNSNPYGATNTNGIYVIDCKGESLVIRNCRIVGTLVLINPGAGSQVAQSVNWTPAVSNYPALLVDGDFDLAFDATALDEGALGVNFNPFGTPNAGGWDDIDQSDSYVSEIAGLVFVSNDLDMTAGAPTVRGCTVAGNTIILTGPEAGFYYDGKYLANPPPGFQSGGPMLLSPGSWRRVVD